MGALALHRTPQQEYEAALAQYHQARVRLAEAKRHYDPKTSPEFKAKAAEYRAKRKAAWNAPEAVAQREREHQELEQRLADIGQAAIERDENMPDDLRIVTRVGKSADCLVPRD